MATDIRRGGDDLGPVLLSSGIEELRWYRSLHKRRMPLRTDGQIWRIAAFEEYEDGWHIFLAPLPYPIVYRC